MPRPLFEIFRTFIKPNQPKKGQRISGRDKRNCEFNNLAQQINFFRFVVWKEKSMKG
jgi:hypothetical protein